MARKVVVELFDDLDGSSAAETVCLSIDGRSVEIDLSASNAEILRGSLAPYIKAGRRLRANGKPVASRIELPPSDSAIRAWAQAHGHPVSKMGRLPRAVRAAFEAHQAA